MKRLLLILILTFGFQSLTKADDITDFEIEGMSIGDSLLDYLSKKEIDKLESSHISEYKQSLIRKDLKNYETVVVSFKKIDNKFIIEGLTGNLGIYKAISSCYKKMNSIEKEVSNMFSKLIRKKWETQKLDKSFQTYTPITYDFKNNDRIQLSCWDFRISKEVDNDRDLFKLSLYTSDYRDATAIEVN